MLPAELLSALQAYALNRDPLPTGAALPAQQAGSPPAPLVLGQQVQATVLAEVSPGMYNVAIGAQKFQVPLPTMPANGASVTLQVVGLEPAVFAFSMPSITTGEASTSTQLGTTAQMLADLLQTPQGPGQGVTAGGVPLVTTSGPLNTVQLAQVLKQALATSGLFYESHQAQWVAGQQTLEHLQQQPQNQPAPGATLSTASPTQSPEGSLPPSQVMSPASGTVNTATGTPVVSAGMAGQGVTIPAHLQGLVQQQLHVLDSGRVIWQGQLASQQPLQWQIWQDRPNAGDLPSSSSQASTGSAWHTEFQLDLPVLGTVAGHVTLDAQGVRLRLSADREITRHLLVQQQPGLVAALGDAGLVVQGAVVTTSPATGGA